MQPRKKLKARTDCSWRKGVGGLHWKPEFRFENFDRCESGVESYLATASSTWGSCSHFFRASTLLVLRWGLASRNTASAHRMPVDENKRWRSVKMCLCASFGDVDENRVLPELGHSCRALAMSVLAMFFKPPLNSRRTDSSLERIEGRIAIEIETFSTKYRYFGCLFSNRFLPQFGSLWIL